MTVPLPPVPDANITPTAQMTGPWQAWFNQLYIYLTGTASGGGGIISVNSKINTTPPLFGGGKIGDNPTIGLSPSSIDNSFLVPQTITNPFLAQMPGITFKGNASAIPAPPQDLSSAQVLLLLDIVNLITQIVDANSFNYPQTAIEAALTPPVVPTSLKVPNGPYRYGAVGSGAAGTAPADTAAWQTLVRVGGIQVIADGLYQINAPIVTSSFISMIGWTRQNTALLSTGFSGPLLQIGNLPNGPNPNAGALERIRFVAAAGNTACLFMQQLSHLWRLNDLIFQNSPCPALINNNCWDANYSNIDILSCATTPGQGAAVQIVNGSNNVYFRGLRVEQCPQGCISLFNAPSIFIEEGKCDQGFIVQSQPTIQVDANSQLNISDFTLTGATGVYPIVTAGSLTLDNVYFTGGTKTPAHIQDNRKWKLINAASNPTFSGTYWGPLIQPLKLGTSRFDYAHPSVPDVTPGVVYSNQGAMTIINQVTVISNGVVSNGTILVGTNLPISFNGQYIGCWLVHGPTGTQSLGEAGSRRKIVQCFIGGNIQVQGIAPMTTDADWTLEYAGGHYTPIEADEVTLSGGISLFYPIALSNKSSPGVTLSLLGYAPATVSNPPVTQYSITGGQLTGTSLVLTGFYLVDDVTGEPYFINNNNSSVINVMYDTTGTGNPSYKLNVAHPFSVISGNKSGVRLENGNFVWNFAGTTRTMPIAQANDYGYDINNMPLWIDSPVSPVTSGTFTATFSGFTTTVTGTVNYQISGATVTLRFNSTISGTSNANTMSFTGLPSTLVPVDNCTVPCFFVQDNTVTSVVGYCVILNTGVVAFGITNLASTVYDKASVFTTSGTKGVMALSTVTYPLT